MTFILCYWLWYFKDNEVIVVLGNWIDYMIGWLNLKLDYLYRINDHSKYNIKIIILIVGNCSISILVLFIFCVSNIGVDEFHVLGLLLIGVILNNRWEGVRMSSGIVFSGFSICEFIIGWGGCDSLDYFYI